MRARLSGGPLPQRKAVELAGGIAQGLAAAHERGIVHRDVKPENVFVTRDGRVKVLDFGLARMVPFGPSASQSGVTAGATEPGMVLGTVGYMSPEQVRGEPADHRSDIFSFGAVFYEMLTGRRAFQGASSVETMMAILHEEPPHLREGSRTLPPELVEIVSHCLEKSPDERFQSARDLAFALRFGERDEVSTASRRAPAIPEKAPSIAVLPFRNMSPNPDAEYFSDGMTEEILNALSQIPSLHVAARTSSFAYRGKDTDVRQIGRELGVGAVLEGSVRQSGQRLRVTAQLVDVGTGYHLWSDRFDRELQDVFAVQDEISRAIVETLKVRLLGAADAPLVAPTTRDVRAYDLYLKGRYLWNRRQTKQAIEQFEAAVAIDPEYADAHLGIADSYAVWGFYGGIPSWEAFARARSAAERAQMLAPGTAGVHLSLGIIEHYYGWDIAREERELRSAIALSPRSHEGFSWLALCFSVSGRADEAREIAQQGVAAEPHSANAQTVLAWTRMGVRRFAEVVPELRRAVELDPEAAFPVWSLGFAQLLRGPARPTPWRRSSAVSREPTASSSSRWRCSARRSSPPAARRKRAPCSRRCATSRGATYVPPHRPRRSADGARGSRGRARRARTSLRGAQRPALGAAALSDVRRAPLGAAVDGDRAEARAHGARPGSDRHRIEKEPALPRERGLRIRCGPSGGQRGLGLVPGVLRRDVVVHERAEGRRRARRRCPSAS